MSFEQFEQSIVAEPLKRVARHWASVRKARRVPGWKDIRPSAIAAELPILWSWKFDAGRDEFTGRLAGDAIEAIFARSFRGASMGELFGPRQAEISARYKRVLTEPAFFRGTGVVFRHLERYGTGERIILPLSETDGQMDGVVGATLYDSVLADLPDQPRSAVEQEEWFAFN